MATVSIAGLECLLLRTAPRRSLAGVALSFVWRTLVPQKLRDAVIEPSPWKNEYYSRVDEELRAKKS